MDMTQIWMLCIVIAMAFFMALQGIWYKMGKKNREEEEK